MVEGSEWILSMSVNPIAITQTQNIPPTDVAV